MALVIALALLTCYLVVRDELIRQIELVSAEEIRAAATMLVHDERLNVAVVSPTAELAEVEAAAKF